ADRTDLDALEVGVRPYVGQASGPGSAGRAVIERVHVGEEHQQVGVDQVRHERGETVVVTEAELVGGDGVVLVDHGQDAELQERGDRLVGVAIAGPTDDVVHRQQDLTGGDLVPGELTLVVVGQQTLSHGGGRLLQGEAPRAPGQAERGESGGDGP